MISNRAVIWLLCVFMLSCQADKTKILTYNLSPKPYVDKVMGVGRIQSANNYTIPVPRVYGPSVKVKELAPEGQQAVEGDTLCKLESTDIHSLQALVSRTEFDKGLSLLNAESASKNFSAFLLSIDDAFLRS